MQSQYRMGCQIKGDTSRVLISERVIMRVHEEESITMLCTGCNRMESESKPSKMGRESIEML